MSLVLVKVLLCETTLSLGALHVFHRLVNLDMKSCVTARNYGHAVNKRLAAGTAFSLQIQLPLDLAELFSNANKWMTSHANADRLLEKTATYIS